jgi:helix-turn-helix resolvase-like protein
VNPDHLEPVSHAENVRRGRKVKLTMADAREIKELVTSGMTHLAVAECFGISRGHVTNIVANRNWKEEL